MEKIINLLEEKNHYLGKFHDINEREIQNFDRGNFDNLEDFYRTRDKILDLIRCIDELIDEENKVGPDVFRAVTREQRSMIEGLLAAKDELVRDILSQDLQILGCVEKEKSNIIREMRSVRRSRKAVGAYHSGHHRKTLDEKA